MTLAEALFEPIDGLQLFKNLPDLGEVIARQTGEAIKADSAAKSVSRWLETPSAMGPELAEAILAACEERLAGQPTSVKSARISSIRGHLPPLMDGEGPRKGRPSRLACGSPQVYRELAVQSLASADQLVFNLSARQLKNPRTAFFRELMFRRLGLVNLGRPLIDPYLGHLAMETREGPYRYTFVFSEEAHCRAFYGDVLRDTTQEEGFPRLLGIAENLAQLDKDGLLRTYVVPPESTGYLFPMVVLDPELSKSKAFNVYACESELALCSIPESFVDEWKSKFFLRFKIITDQLDHQSGDSEESNSLGAQRVWFRSIPIARELLGEPVREQEVSKKISLV